MKDSFGREINYLRVSVTDRCNLRCTYCMGQHDITFINRQDILDYEQIVHVVETAVEFGITIVRLTGGEPLSRKNICHLVSMLAGIDGIRELAMTTNGTLLSRFARPLAEAGLQRINISLDTLDPDRYRSITCGGDITDVLEGIEAARQAGFHPIKLNCVISDWSTDDDINEIDDFARKNRLELRYIQKMDLKKGTFSVVKGGQGGDCHRCNRLRLTCDGYIRPCLFSDLSFSVRELGIREALLRAIEGKPWSGKTCSTRLMGSIGG